MLWLALPGLKVFTAELLPLLPLRFIIIFVNSHTGSTGQQKAAGRHKGEDRMALQHSQQLQQQQHNTTHKFTIKFNSFAVFPQKVMATLQQKGPTTIVAVKSAVQAASERLWQVQRLL